MSDYKTLAIERKGPIATIVLDRPEVKNAFDEELIAELTAVCRDFSEDDKTRVVTLTGKGEIFSAGADLNWMRRVADYTYDEFGFFGVVV